jgi:hypothetical protein
MEVTSLQYISYVYSHNDNQFQNDDASQNEFSRFYFH